MSEDVTLKPCPFCGGTPTVITDDLYDGSISIECCQVGCRANVQGETYDLNEKDKAIEHWNTRKGEDERIAQAVAAERARVVAALKAQLIPIASTDPRPALQRITLYNGVLHDAIKIAKGEIA